MSVIFTEGFETDGNGVRYATSVPEFTDGFGDFFTRTDGSNIGSFYEVSGQEGSFYFAAQDLDGDGEAAEQTLEISSIDITNFENLVFNILLAEDDSSDGNEDWDAVDFLSIGFQIDGGGFQNLLAVENDGSEFNSAPFIDTDFDGVGDGAELTDVFTNFSAAIAGAGSELDLRITFNLNAGDEDIAIDDIQITGDAIVVPESAFTLELLHIADQEAATAAIADAPRLSAVLNALRAQDLGDDGIEDNTLTLSSGDAFIPGVFFSASEAAFGAGGVADIQIQNELGIEAIAFGNHEFDFGTGTLSQLITGQARISPTETESIADFTNSFLDGTALDDLEFEGAQFSYLSTNLDYSTDSNMAPLEVAGGGGSTPNSVTSSIVSVVNGEPIGVVGATTPTLASISSPGSIGISPTPFDTNPTPEQLDALAAEIQAEVDQLLADNPTMNKVILLAHMQQLSIELGLAERLVNVDIIVGGGSNTRLFDENDRAREGDSNQGAYPQFVTNAGGTTTAVVNTDGSYKYVGRLVIDFDSDGNIISESYDADVSGAYATDAQGVSDLAAEGLIDPEIQAIVNAIEAEIIATESNVFGVSDVFLNGNRSGTFAPDDPDGVRTQETNLGNLTADANLAAAQEIDPTVVLSLKNGGGIRADIGDDGFVPPGGSEAIRVPNEEVVDGDGNVIKPAGGISQNDIATTLAFNNGLVLMTLTKAEIVGLLEHGVSSLPGVAGSFPQIAGVKFSFDEFEPSGDRIQNAGIFDADGELVAELVRDGEIAGDPAEQFRIVTLDFLARPRFDSEGNFTGGGDGYPFPNTNTDPDLLKDENGVGPDAEIGPDAARINLVTLEEEGVQTGDATFADDGTEQDALAEYLDDNFNPENGGTAFDEFDTGPALDERIQNLVYREDTVLPAEPAPEADLLIEALGTEELAGAEIVAFDPITQRAFVTSSEGVQVVDASDPSNPVLISTISPEALGFDSSDITSVAVSGDIVAMARPDITGELDDGSGDPFTGAGQVLFYSASTLAFLGAVAVGPLPDMLTFNEDGTILLVANEGQSSGAENEPDALENPEGSISVITLNTVNPSLSEVTTLGFDDPSITFESLADKGVRVAGPDNAANAAPSAAADLEPEYITVEGNTAFIALQENNAVAVIRDITNPEPFTIDDIIALGTKDHSVAGNGLDPSNRDSGINIDTYDINGLYMPDGLASYEVDGELFFFTANEGDGRDVDESRGADLVDGDLSNGEIDVDEVSDELQAQLADDALLGRLKFSNIDGDIDGDGLIEELFSFGARSFTIFDEEGNVVFDSGDDFEQITAKLVPEVFNGTDDGSPGSFDSRSDDKGPEPEAVELGEIGDQVFAFIGLERVGGIMVYNVTDPTAVTFDQYIRNEDENGQLIDIAPEGLEFISAEHSPTGEALLAVASEESNTLTFHTITPVADPGPEITLISEIQGDTDFSGITAQVGIDDVSALNGETVTIEAIVTADMQDGTVGSDLNGFFLQEEDSDADDNASTSEGIFVFDGLVSPLVDVNVGDKVQITGTVTEFFGMTQITAEFIEVVSTGNSLPTATVVTFPTTGVMLDDDGNFIADLESVEGMLVTIPTDMTVTEMFNLDRFGEYRVSSDGRLEQFTQNNAPDQEGFGQHLQDIAARSITFDDGRTDQNPDVLEIVDGNDGVLTADDSFRMGDTITNATGVINYAFDEFRLQDAVGDYAETNPRPVSPNELEGNFKVASLNVLNYFTTLDDRVTQTDTGLSPRGADDLTRFDSNSDLANTDPNAEFDRQTAKLVNAIVEIDADVLGLVELENSATDAAISNLVDAVNAALGGPVYDYIATGLVGADAITQGLIYKTGTVTPVGDFAVLTEFEGRNFLDPLDAGRDLNRPALAQTFEHEASAEEVTIAVNHLKSKGSLSGDPADEDQLDGAGNNNATRTEAADILADWLASDPTGTGAENQLIIGDLNAYAQEDPITTLEAAGFADLAEEVLGDDSYTFVFDGQIGTLDYVMANNALLDNLAGFTEWHINADEADAIDYNLDFGRDADLFDGNSPARNSDHDPVIASFQFTPRIEGTDKNDRLTGTDEGEIIDGLGGNDRYVGLGGNDIFVAGAGDRDWARDFVDGEDLVDLTQWGTQSFDELQIKGGKGFFRIQDISTGDRFFVASGDRDFTEMTAENFIFAPIENLVIIGTDGNDKNLDGRSGDDLFDGLAGNDRYTGNGGADRFIMGDGDKDRIEDYELGIDLIDLTQWGTSFEELRIKGDNGKFRIDDGFSGNRAFVRTDDRDIDVDDFAAENFIFDDPLAS